MLFFNAMCYINSRFYTRQLYRQVLLRARISYGDSVCPSRPGMDSRPGEIETPGLHPMIAQSLVSYEVIWCRWVRGFPSNEGIKERYPPQKSLFYHYWLI